eukprot:6458613-Amphidinium_carterae.5
MGLLHGNEHIRPSAKSLKAKALQTKTPLTAEVRLSNDQEFSMSTLGLLLFLVHLAAASNRCQSQTILSQAERASSLLATIIDKILGQQQWDIQVPVLGSKLEIQGVMVSSLKGLLSHSPLKRHKIAQSEKMALHTVLIQLKLTEKGSASDAAALCKQLCLEIATFVAHAFEVFLPLSGESRLALQLPTLR